MLSLHETGKSPSGTECLSQLPPTVNSDLWRTLLTPSCLPIVMFVSATRWLVALLWLITEFTKEPSWPAAFGLAFATYRLLMSGIRRSRGISSFPGFRLALFARPLATNRLKLAVEVSGIKFYEMITAPIQLVQTTRFELSNRREAEIDPATRRIRNHIEWKPLVISRRSK